MIRNERDKMQIYGGFACDVFAGLPGRSRAPSRSRRRGNRRCWIGRSLRSEYVSTGKQRRKGKRETRERSPAQRESHPTVQLQSGDSSTPAKLLSLPAAVTTPSDTAAGVSVHGTPSPFQHLSLFGVAAAPSLPLSLPEGPGRPRPRSHTGHCRRTQGGHIQRV